jgi:hypothetical protein
MILFMLKIQKELKKKKEEDAKDFSLRLHYPRANSYDTIIRIDRVVNLFEVFGEVDNFRLIMKL